MEDSSDGKGEKPPDITKGDNNGDDGEIFENLYNPKNTNGTSFRVIVDKIPKSSPISNLKIGELMNKITVSSNINEIKRVSRNRVVVNLRTPQAANLTVNHELMRKNELKAYIPLYYTSRAAVIRDVDIEYDNQTLKDNIDARQFSVRKVERLNRRITEDKTTKYVPSKSVKIHFDGQDIPQHIYIYNVRFECEPFIRRLRQCLLCLRFGHSANACSGDEKCTKCAGANHKADECSVVESKCANCNGRHNAFDKQCPEKRRQIDINTAMGMYNLSFQEASLEHPRTYLDTRSFAFVSRNRFQILANDEENFPEINPSQNDTEIPMYNPPPKLTFFKKKPRKFKYKQQHQFTEETTQFRREESTAESTKQRQQKRRQSTSEAEDQVNKNDQEAKQKQPEVKKVRNTKDNSNARTEEGQITNMETNDEQNEEYVDLSRTEIDTNETIDNEPGICKLLGVQIETENNLQK